MPRRMSSSSVRCSTHSESIVRRSTSRSTIAQSVSPTSASFASSLASASSRRCAPSASREPTSQRSSSDVPGPSRPMAWSAWCKRLEAPVVRVLAGAVQVEERLDLLVEEGPNRVGQVLVVEDLVALGVDRLALLVDDVVVLDDALADVEVEALDARLRALDRLADHPRLDRDVVLEAEALHEAGDSLRGEPLHEVVLEGQVEAGGAGVALATGTTAELVVDAPAVVALRADDVEPAGRHDDVVLGVAARLRLAEDLVVRRLVHLGRVEAALVEHLRGQAGRVAAEHDVGPAAGHVRGDRHRPAAPGLGDDPGLLLVELGVEDLVLDPAPAEHLAEDLGLLDGDRADEDGAARLGHLLDLVDHGIELAVLVPEDEVRVVVADHRLVRRDRDDLEPVDLVELLGLGHRRAGHAGQLVVEAEVVLERDRGERDRLALDAQPLLGLDRLVEPLAPAAAGHLAPGELVDDDDLAVLDEVVLVAPVERVSPERLLEVPGVAGVGVVEVRQVEEPLHLRHALLGGRDGAVLEVDEVVAALLGALGASLELRHEAGEGVVEVGRLLGLPADDERGAGLVDEDVVDLVDDPEEALALDPLVELRDHVVAEVVEAVLVVRAVGDVGGVGLAAGDRAEVDEALVARRVARLEDVGGVVDDDPHREPEEVVDRPHPLGVAAGEVVVDRHDVDAAPGQAVEGGGERRHEGLALARLHLGDLALVEDRAADELDVEVAHPEGPLHRLAGAGEDLREDVVEGRLELLVLLLAARLLHVTAALEVVLLELVRRWGRSRPGAPRARRGSRRRGRGCPRRTRARARPRARWWRRRAAGSA